MASGLWSTGHLPATFLCHWVTLHSQSTWHSAANDISSHVPAQEVLWGETLSCPALPCPHLTAEGRRPLVREGHSGHRGPLSAAGEGDSPGRGPATPSEHGASASTARRRVAGSGASAQFRQHRRLPQVKTALQEAPPATHPPICPSIHLLSTQNGNDTMRSFKPTPTSFISFIFYMRAAPRLGMGPRPQR